MGFLATTIGLLGLGLGAWAQPHAADATTVSLYYLSPDPAIVERLADIGNASSVFDNKTGNGREIIGLQLLAKQQLYLAYLGAPLHKVTAVGSLYYLALLVD